MKTKPSYYESRYLNGDVDTLADKTDGLTIDAVETKSIGTPPTEKILLEFEGMEKPYILSKANYPMVETALGEDLDKWVGHKVYFQRLAKQIAGVTRTIADIRKVQ